MVDVRSDDLLGSVYVLYFVYGSRLVFQFFVNLEEMHDLLENVTWQIINVMIAVEGRVVAGNRNDLGRTIRTKRSRLT